MNIDPRSRTAFEGDRETEEHRRGRGERERRRGRKEGGERLATVKAGGPRAPARLAQSHQGRHHGLSCFQFLLLPG